MTLIELVLSVAIASLVLLTALGVLTSIQRSRDMLARRADETASLHRTRLVLQRAFSTMLVSNITAQTQAQNQTAVARPVDQASDQAAAANIDQVAIADPPRVILELDPALQGVLLRQQRPDGSTLESAPQRLEMVLIDSPVATPEVDPFAIAKAVRRDTRRLAPSERERVLGQSGQAQSPTPEGAPIVDDAASESAESEEEEEESVRAVRGVFELRPQQVVTQATLDRAAQTGEPLPEAFTVSEQPLFELWWVPLAARRSVEEIREMSRLQRRIEAVTAGEPELVASDITFLRVRMFDDRNKHLEWAATYQKDLPAYIEVDVETRSGIRGEWLFEVGWATGPETGKQAELARQRRVNTVQQQSDQARTGSPAGPGGTGTGTGAGPVRAAPIEGRGGDKSAGRANGRGGGK
jgi:hypothetical protein